MFIVFLFFSTVYTAMRGPTFSIQHSNYPAVESAGEVTVCVAYYGTRPLAANTTVELSTDDDPVFPGQSPGTLYMSTHAVTLYTCVTTYEYSILWYYMSLPSMYVQLYPN